MSQIRRLYYKSMPEEMRREMIRHVLKKTISQNKYAGRNVLSIDEGNKKLFESIKDGRPYMVTRYGANELDLAIDGIIHNKIDKYHLHRMKQWSGFFPETDEMAYKFGELMIEISQEIDMDALYYSHGEEFFLTSFAPKAVLVHNRAIEPWYSMENPWTSALKGKKVLIIHPFENTIINQYNNREKLFPNSNLLPKFELLTLKAVQTVASENDSRFNDWFEALDWMYQETLKLDYDIAILGCGAYGLPLAGKIKRSGKIAVHLGGATQLLFGIKGKRWDSHPDISKLYNEAWVRPSEEDKPKDAEKVENGCYW